MARDGSLSNFPGAADQFPILWDIGQDRIHGTDAGTRQDLERASQWNMMFDACLNIERYAQKLFGTGFHSYNATGGVIHAQNLILSWNSITVPASSTANSSYRFTVPDCFGSNPFNDWRFTVSVNTYVNVIPSTYLKPAAANQGAQADGDYRPEILSTYQPITFIQPVSGRVFDVLVYQLKMHTDSQQIGQLIETCQRPATTDVLGSRWSKNGSHTAMGIGSPAQSVGSVGTHLYLCSEGEYGSTDPSFWQPNAGFAFPTSMGISNDQECIFSPYGWVGSGVDVGDKMFRALFALRVSGDWISTTNLLNFYAVVLGDEGMPSSNRPTVGRLVKAKNLYMWNINPFDSYLLTAADPSSSITQLGTFSLKTSNDDGFPNLRYRFTVQGSSLTVEEATDGSTYSTVLTVGDAELTAGSPGMFVFPMQGTGSLEKCKRLMFFNYLSYRVLSGESPCDIHFNLLYSLVGRNPITTQSL